MYTFNIIAVFNNLPAQTVKTIKQISFTAAVIDAAEWIRNRQDEYEGYPDFRGFRIDQE